MENYFLDPTQRLDKIYNIIDNSFIHYGGNIHNTPRKWKTDVSGKFCLISKNFWYFGKSPIENIEELQDLYLSYIDQKKIKKSEYLDNLKRFISKYKNGSNLKME